MIKTLPLVKITTQNQIVPTPVEDAFLFRQFLNDFQAEEPQVKNEQDDGEPEKKSEDLSKEGTIEPVINEAIYALIRPKMPEQLPGEMKEVAETQKDQADSKQEKLVDYSSIPTINGEEEQDVSETPKTSRDALTLGRNESANQTNSTNTPLQELSQLNREISNLMPVNIGKIPIQEVPVEDYAQSKSTSSDGEKELSELVIAEHVTVKDWSLRTAIPENPKAFENKLQEPNPLSREVSDLMPVNIGKIPIQEVPAEDYAQSKSIYSDGEKELSESAIAEHVIAKDWSLRTAIPENPEAFENKLQEPNQLSREISDLITVTIKKMPLERTSTASVQVKLSPEKLGDLEIELTWREGQVEAKIIVSKPELKQQLVEQLASIHEQLPKNPIVQVIMIEIKPPIDLSQQSYPRKQTQSPPKNRHASNGRGEEETETSDNLALLGLSLYV